MLGFGWKSLHAIVVAFDKAKQGVIKKDETSRQAHIFGLISDLEEVVRIIAHLLGSY